MSDNTKNELLDQVQHIARTIEQCDWNNGATNEELGLEEDHIPSAFDYLQDVLDFEWILHSDKTLKGARILVAYGGPNIWVNTVSRTIEGYWWGKQAFATYEEGEGSYELDDAISTIFNC